MERINNFIVLEINRKDENTIVLTSKIDDQIKSFEVVFLTIGVNFPTQLEFLLRANEVALSKNLLQLLQDYKNGEKIQLPCQVFSQTLEYA
jgi:hypothetical protein